ncbi:MAG: helix-turn-helix domain-containing protein [Candidatus Rokubacteria bacterium]|nr:helix-turn-helix domain-containing protein [Candidatus Rokubacteria bacterium]
MNLLTIREVCERLRISRATLYKLVKRGMLPLVKVGGKSLVPEEAILKLLGVTPRSPLSEEQAWERYYEELLRLGLTTPESREAIVAPRFADFVPVEVSGKPASALIIEEREAH